LQFDDATFKSLNRDGFTFVNHQLISTIWKLNNTCQTLGSGETQDVSVEANTNRQAPRRLGSSAKKERFYDKRSIHTPV
jgi:hypothetical protein